MRRTQFITAAIVAALTFFSLQAFVGYRYGSFYGPRWGYRQHGYYAPGCYDNNYFNGPNGQRSAPLPLQKDTVR